MKKLLTLFLILAILPGMAQITVKVGSALQQAPGSEIHLPVTVEGLGPGHGITALELHIGYSNTHLVYDTTLNFTPLMPAAQWFFAGNGLEYSTNWLQPQGQVLSIPDQTVLFDIAFTYLGGATELTFDTARCLLIDSAFNVLSGVIYVNGTVTPSQGSGESRWNGSGAWNTVANWSNGIPGDSTDAIVETGSVIIESAAGMRNLTIRPGASVAVSPDFSLSVHSGLINDGTLELRSDLSGSGSVIVRGTASGSGVNRFQCSLNPDGGTSHFVSSPVSGATANVFGSNPAERYDAATGTWIPVSGSEPLGQGSGYRVTALALSTAVMEGTFPTTSVSPGPLAFPGSSQPELQGLTLLGNPFPSAISLDRGNWNRVQTDRAAYVWSGYKYVTWNGMIGSLTEGIIPAMQGFFVKAHASGGSVVIPAESRLHSNLPFYKESEAVTDMMALMVENLTDADHFDEAFVQVLPGTSPGFDPESDAWKLDGSAAYAQIWTKTPGGSRLAINTLPEFQSIPVEIRTGSAGSYKVTFGNTASFDPGRPLFFEDKLAGTVINIRNSGMYVFTSAGTTETDRFLLHFQEVGMDETNHSAISVRETGNTLHVLSTQSNLTAEQIRLFDLAGRIVFSFSDQPLPATLAHKPLSPGLYILKIDTPEGVFTHKLLVR